MKAKVIFVHNRFNIFNPGTYMSVFIRFALSLDNWNTGDASVHFNHCAFLMNNGDVIEAGWNKEKKRGEVIVRSSEDFFKGRKLEDYFITKEFDLVKNPYKEIGKEYGLKDVIIWQVCYLWSRKNVWKGTTDYATHYCSKLVAYCLGKDKAYLIDPEVLYSMLVK